MNDKVPEVLSVAAARFGAIFPSSHLLTSLIVLGVLAFILWLSDAVA
jgi:hypothetical protein